MYKIITRIALIGVFSVGTIGGLGQSISAADGGEYSTKANIIFETNDGITDPVDPEDPEKEVEPEIDPDVPDPILPGTKGPLSIDYASHINFGTVLKSGNAQTYLANPITVDYQGEKLKRAPYVQITDDRGTKAGWSLTVEQKGQLANGDSELEGAELKLSDGTLNSMSSLTNIEVDNDIVLDPKGGAHDVMGAKNDGGAGTYTNQFGKVNSDDKAESVTLSVPGDLVIEDGKYSTTLEWKLTDAPR